MSKKPSTWTRVAYGTSTSSSPTTNSASLTADNPTDNTSWTSQNDTIPPRTTTKPRRDSTAPLIHGPPIPSPSTSLPPSASSSSSSITSSSSMSFPAKTSGTSNKLSYKPLQHEEQYHRGSSLYSAAAQSHSSVTQQQQRHLHQRRRRSPSQTETKVNHPTNDIELNTSDENISSDDDDDDDDDDDNLDNHDEGDTLLNNKITTSSQNGYHIQIDNGPGSFDHRWEQCLLLEEEDVQVMISGYRYHTLRYLMYQLGCIITLGIVWLIGRWIPTWWIKWVGQQVPLKDARWLVFKNQYNQFEILRPQREFYGGTMGSVFSIQQIKEELAQLSVSPRNDQLPFLNLDEQLQHLTLVDYRYVRLAYHPLFDKFLITGFYKDHQWTSVKNLKLGLSTGKYIERLSVFGPNIINIHEKPTMKLLTDEVLNPFYVFQIGSIILWSMDDYYYYAFCIFVISAFSIITTLVETKQTMKRMRDMSRFECSVRTFRNGSWRVISSVDLVPGDLIDIGDLHTVPCDAMLITGDCILNESMLTGESVPVSKLPMVDVTLRKLDLSGPTIPAEVTKHFLFNGTKVVRVRSENNISATAMVVRTGFNTAKGALVRSMLFPKPNNFKFYRDSFKFIGVLSIIAILGFLISSINFIRLGIDSATMILRALDLITIVVPPALPATMSIGTSFAIHRLKRLGIFCISPPRVNIGGKVDCMCFDKTGTLTEDGLDVHGIRTVAIQRQNNDGSKVVFEPESTSILNTTSQQEDENSSRIRMLRAMTTCHSLKIVGGELVGDPLDLKMFGFTGWELEESGGMSSMGLTSRNELTTSHVKKSAKIGIMPTVVRPPGGRQDLLLMQSETSPTTPIEFGIIHSFEFVSSLRRMSVIVRQLANTYMEVFVKGAPEVMMDICTPESIPKDYQEQLYWYTHRGYRVIACASRPLDGVKWHKLHKLKRQEVECNLTFLGFIIFENKLKPRTVSALVTLRNANIRQIMCTGDNILTAISVSRECGLVEQHAEIYIPKFLQGSSTDPDSILSWESVLQEGNILDNKTLMPRRRESHYYDHPFGGGQEPYYLAVTGEAFRWMIDYSKTDLLGRMLIKGAIYGRMSPDEKQELVMALQDIGYCVGFCGDGANDCGALKAGDIGISLSEAEASVAAPFTSNTMDIECVIDVIKEGRAALVTSFSCFKYMALYSLIQFTSVTLLYAFGSNLGDFQFLYIDLFLILPIAVYMGYTDAWPQLYRKRPTASLVSKKVLTSLIGHIMINSGFQLFAYWLVHQQSWYTAPEFDPNGQNISCYENTVLFLVSSYQYILVAVVFSVGPPYRQPLWTNGRFMITLVFLVTFTTWSVLWPTDFLTDLLELEYLPIGFRLLIIGLALLNFGISMICEKWLFVPLASWLTWVIKTKLIQGDYQRINNVSHSSKLYKRLIEEMDR
ncbi:P-type ATPase-like protein [Halteromyces radiatus]|uniref:P-type ATPase-like protein n=1 Tax=Halteromyces radiatus TaxID=101107 RepID=UPI002220FA50|nr:P-type ATPase-like protein [Halteromyces radiatus]KAI8077803.1 P-type ATPase-like protein [Halteromyces radiatus]